MITAVALVWVLSLVGVGVLAQDNQPATVTPAPGTKVPSPSREIISGENIGFKRVVNSSDRPGQVTGQLMVKIDGTWLEIVPPVKVVGAGAKN
jgi:hypothetical protein